MQAFETSGMLSENAIAYLKCKLVYKNMYKNVHPVQDNKDWCGKAIKRQL